MILEAAQILSTTNNLISKGGPYRTTHPNHPVTVWARQSLDNYLWVCDYGLFLSSEYKHRFSKKHKCEELIRYMKYNRPNFDFKDMTEHPKCVPDYCKVDCPIDSYRNYYINEKQHLFKWTKRKIPEWIILNNN